MVLVPPWMSIMSRYGFGKRKAEYSETSFTSSTTRVMLSENCAARIFFQEAIVGDGEALADQFLRETGVVEVEVNAIRVRDACGFEGDIVTEIDGDAGVSGRLTSGGCP